MGKTLSFNVKLSFTDKIVDDVEIMAIASNIARAIYSEANNGMGITTDDIEACTKTVEVKPQFINESITLDIF